MKKRVLAFDLDGTLTEHRTWITDERLALLDLLRADGYRLMIVGAGQARRIFTQLREYPMDIVGNYGLQYAVYRDDLGDLEFVRDLSLPCDRESVSERIMDVRAKTGYTEFAGDPVEFHPTGCVTFPLLGTKANIADKLLFDPTREKRRAIHEEVARAFPEYSVFIGGSSSFDMAPKPYDKYYALTRFCEDEGYDKSEITYFGDDYGKGGNDECVYLSDIDFVKVEKYSVFDEAVGAYLRSLAE
jgi:hydroxymethylpyrimidine pyrophosphatase-like HAD family hydrolase